MARYPSRGSFNNKYVATYLAIGGVVRREMDKRMRARWYTLSSFTFLPVLLRASSPVMILLGSVRASR